MALSTTLLVGCSDLSALLDESPPSKRPAHENRRPFANAGGDLAGAIGDEARLDGSASYDPDGDALKFSWTLKGQEAGEDAILSGANTATPTLLSRVEGMYVVELTVSDGELEDRDTAVIYVSGLDGVLPPDGAYAGPDGLRLAPTEGALAEAIGVSITAAELSSLQLPALPEGVEGITSAYRLRAARDVSAPFDEAFLVELPIPEGADESALALALYSPAEDFVSSNEGIEGEWEGDFVESGMWEVLSAHLDSERRVVVSALAQLRFEGRHIVLVQAPGIIRARLSSASRASEARFNASCMNFAELANASDCDENDEADLEAALEQAYEDYRGAGLALPYLAREIFGSASTNISVGDYLAELHPYISDNGNDTLDLCESVGGVRNNGRYSSGSKMIYVCMGTSVTSSTIDTARHEYFHATQYGYDAVRNGRRQAWVMEGMATASEKSLADMSRYTRRTPHHIDEPLTSNTDLAQYKAQDFWVWLGRQRGEGVGYLGKILREGANVDAVDRALRSHFNLGLDVAYWEWAKNQGFEVMDDLDSALGPPCEPNPRTATPQRLSWTPASGTMEHTFSLAPLNSVLVELDLTASAEVESRLHIAVERGTSALQVKLYNPSDLGTTNCHAGIGLSARDQMVSAGAQRTAYALISNTSLHQENEATLSLSPWPTVSPSVVGGFREDQVGPEVRALVSGFTNPAGVEISWRFRHLGDAVFYGHPATSAPAETVTLTKLPCDDLTLMAEATDPSTGESASGLTTVSCITQFGRALYYAVLEKSGTVRSDGAVTRASNADVDTLFIGDDESDRGTHALLHFPFLIDVERIESAQLTFIARNVQGNPVAGLGTFFAMHAAYGDELDSGDYRTMGNVQMLPGVAQLPVVSGLVTVDVTTVVQAAFNYEMDRVQLMVFFDHETNENGVVDGLEISARDEQNFRRPALEITYANF